MCLTVTTNCPVILRAGINWRIPSLSAHDQCLKLKQCLLGSKRRKDVTPQISTTPNLYYDLEKSIVCVSRGQDGMDMRVHSQYIDYQVPWSTPLERLEASRLSTKPGDLRLGLDNMKAQTYCHLQLADRMVLTNTFNNIEP
jgi:hypothetical protein